MVREVFDATRRQDWDSVLAACSPDIEWDDRDLRPEGRVHRGIDAMRDEMRVWFGTWANYWQEVEQMVDAGDDVVVVVREGGQGRGSGIAMEQRIGMVMTVRGGQIVRTRLYRDPSKAFEVAGLSQ